VIHMMNGTEVGRALVNRFEAVEHEEIVRLRRKLGIFNDEDRRSLEVMIADVVSAMAGILAGALGDECHPKALEAVVRVFNLEMSHDLPPPGRRRRRALQPSSLVGSRLESTAFGSGHALSNAS
jgi:hypothetical protein